MGCVQCKDKEATKLTEDQDTSLSHAAGYHYGADPAQQRYPSFGVTAIPNYNNFHAPVGQGMTVFGGVSTSSHTGTLRTRGGTGKGCRIFKACTSPVCLCLNFAKYHSGHNWVTIKQLKHRSLASKPLPFDSSHLLSSVWISFSFHKTKNCTDLDEILQVA